jgi:hypothetical protein
VRPLLAVVAALILALAACADDDDAPPQSGIDGLVLRGPLCPVIVEGSPCPDAPLPGAPIRITPAGGGEPANVISDDRGRFRVALSPGDYDVEPLPIDGGPLPAPGPAQRVTVTHNRYTEITVTYDTGIR